MSNKGTVQREPPLCTYTYDAYGNVLSQSGSHDNPYQFSTKEYNAGSGLAYFGARYYDPSTGRFITPDPLGFIDGPNVYLYCNNNPVNFADPWGLCGEKLYRISGFTAVGGYVLFGAGGGGFEITDIATGESATYSYLTFGIGAGAHVEMSSERIVKLPIDSVRELEGNSVATGVVLGIWKLEGDSRLGESNRWLGLNRDFILGLEVTGITWNIYNLE